MIQLKTDEPMSIEKSLLIKDMTLDMLIDKHHPALAGHFPGNPIVPGVVILDHLIQLWQKQSGQSVNSIMNAKFINLLRPDISCRIHYTAKAQHINFLVTTSGPHSMAQQETDPVIICKGLFSYE